MPARISNNNNLLEQIIIKEGEQIVLSSTQHSTCEVYGTHEGAKVTPIVNLYPRLIGEAAKQLIVLQPNEKFYFGPYIITAFSTKEDTLE